MSTTRAPIQNIPLNGSLNLNKLKSDIRSFSGFNENNSPVYGNCLSPLFVKKESKASGVDYEADSEGNLYSIAKESDGVKVKINGVTFRTIPSNTYFVHKQTIKSYSEHFTYGISSDGKKAWTLLVNGLISVYTIGSSGLSLDFTTNLPQELNVSSTQGATFFHSVNNSNILYLFIHHDLSIIDCYKINLNTHTCQLVSTNNTTLSWEVAEYQFPCLFAIESNSKILVTIYPKTGSSIKDPKSVTFIYNYNNDTWSSTSPATVSVPSPNTGNTEYLPNSVGIDGFLHPLHKNIGISDSTAPTSGTTNVNIQVYTSDVGPGPASSAWVGKFNIKGVVDWTKVATISGTCKYHRYDSDTDEDTLNWSINANSTVAQLSFMAYTAAPDVSIAITGTTMKPSYTDTTTYPITAYSGELGIDVTKEKTYTLKYSHATSTGVKYYIYNNGAITSVNSSTNTITGTYGYGHNALRSSSSWEVIPSSGQTVTVKQQIVSQYELNMYQMRVLLPNVIPCNITGASEKTYIPSHMTMSLLYSIQTMVDTVKFSFQPITRTLYEPGYVRDVGENSWRPCFGEAYSATKYRNDYPSTTPRFTMLLNNGSVYGVSISQPGSSQADIDRVGTLVADWDSISGEGSLYPRMYHFNDVGPDNVAQVSSCILSPKSNLSELDFFWVDDVPESQMALGRYLIINTVAYDNLYDTVKGKWYTAFKDYNSRNTLSSSVRSAIVTSAQSFIDEASATDGTFVHWVLWASSMDTFYNDEGMQVPYTSLQVPPQVVAQLNLGNDITGSVPVSSNDYIDFYVTSKYNSSSDINISLLPDYYTSVNSSKTLITRVALQGKTYLTYQNTWLQNLTIFAQYINSYVGKDMVIESGVGYPLLTQNGLPILAVSALGSTGSGAGIEGLRAMFVIQSLIFVVTDSYIMSVSIDNSVVNTVSAVANITGLRFLGFDTKQALFYSEYNKTIYSFTGDSVLNPIYEVTELTDIYTSVYNPTTTSIIVATNKGLLVINQQMGVYCIDIKNVTDITYIAKLLLVQTDTDIYTIKLNPDVGYDRIPVKLATCYYGLGNQQQSKIDTFYIRLFSDTRESGSVKLRVKALTDNGYQTEEKEFKIHTTDWDTLTSTFYLRYQPKYQTSVGTSLELESDFAIQCIQLGVTPLGTTQLVKNNI